MHDALGAPLGQRGNRARGIQADRARQGGAVHHVQAGMAEHLAMAVHHTLFDAVGHVAAAQRMRGDQVVRQCPGGRHKRRAAGGGRQHLVHLDHGIDRVLAGAVVPVHLQRAAPRRIPDAPEVELTIGRVHRLAEPRHHVGQRVLHVGMTAQVGPEPLELASRQLLEPLADEVGRQVGHAAVLDEQRLLLVDTVQQVDRAADGGAV